MVVTRDWYVADESGWTEDSQMEDSLASPAAALLAKKRARELGLPDSEIGGTETGQQDPAILELKSGNSTAWFEAFLQALDVALPSENPHIDRKLAAFVLSRLPHSVKTAESEKELHDTLILLREFGKVAVYEIELKNYPGSAPQLTTGARNLWQHFEKVPDPDRTVFWSYIFRGERADDIGRRFDIPQARVYALVKSVREKLVRRLEGDAQALRGR